MDGSKVNLLFLSIQLIDDDQRNYRRFNVLVTDRWQAEMIGQ